MTNTITADKIQPGEHFISVTKGIRGWFACEFWLNNESEDSLGLFWEPWQSDPMSYKTEDEARVRAIQLANDEGIPYLLPSAHRG